LRSLLILAIIAMLTRILRASQNFPQRRPLSVKRDFEHFLLTRYFSFKKFGLIQEIRLKYAPSTLDSFLKSKQTYYDQLHHCLQPHGVFHGYLPAVGVHCGA
jgi:hypothetical protein